MRKVAASGGSPAVAP